jgi:HSP20 family molecular chaperone IbpA
VQSQHLLSVEDPDLDDKKDDAAAPFLSSMLDDLFFDRPFPSVASILNDMERTQARFFSDFWNHGDEAPGNPLLPTHPCLRGRSPSFLPQHPQQRFDVTENDEKFQVSFDLPEGMFLEDLQIHVRDGGSLLVIHGETQTSDSNIEDDEAREKMPVLHFQQSTSTRFTQSFSLDPDVLCDQFIATAKGGRVTISAPKDDRKLKTLNRAIPIQDLDAIAAKAEAQKRFTKDNRPHFLHKSIPFVDKSTEYRVGEGDTNEETEDARSNQGDVGDESNGESQDFIGSSSL